MSLFGSKGTSDSAGSNDGAENTNETLAELQTASEASSSLSSRMGNALNVARMGVSSVLTAGALSANILAGGAAAVDNRAPTSLEPPAAISAEASTQSPLLQDIQPEHAELRREPTEEEMQAQEENKQFQEINEVRESLEGLANEQEKQNEAYREEGKIVGEDAARPQIVAVAEPETPSPHPVEPAPVDVADAVLPVEVVAEPVPEGPGNAGSSNGGGDGGA